MLTVRELLELIASAEREISQTPKQSIRWFELVELLCDLNRMLAKAVSQNLESLERVA